MARANDYNLNALFYQEQIVILDTTNAGSTSGSLVVKGGISGKDTYVTGHISVNNVKITPNKNDIIYEQQATLNITEEFTSIQDFYFDNSIAHSFKAIINVNVNAGISKYALWEINGVYKPSGWVITSSFTGELTGVNFKIANSNGRGQIQYTNTNANGTTTTIRYRATTTAPPGSSPLGEGSGLINNTSGPYIANRLLYSNSTDTIANTDIEYNANIFSIGGNSRILARNANSFTNFSNGGGITSMGDASVAKKMIVGENVGIVTTAPQFTLDVGGDINFTGNFYKNGSLYSGTSIWDTNTQNEIYTLLNLGIGTTDPTYNLDVSGNARISEGLTAASFNVTNQTATNISSGSLVSATTKVTDSSIGTLNVTGLTAGNINFTGSLYQNGAPYISSQWTSRSAGSLTYIDGNVGINTTQPGSTLDVNGKLTSVDVSSTNASIGTLNATGLTAGNINFTGSLYQNGAPYIGSQWTSGSAGKLSYVDGNVGIATTDPTANLHVNGTAYVSSHFTAGSLNVPGATVLANVTATGLTSSSAQITTLAVTNETATSISSGTLSLSTGLTSASAHITDVTSTNISAGGLNLSTGLTSGSARITNARVTTSSIGTLVNTTMTSTDISSGTLNLSTGLTSASAQVTTLNVTNEIATNISSATLNLSTGLTSASAQITNQSSTNISSGTLNLSTGVTTASAKVTNLVSTNSSLGTINALGATMGGHFVPSTTLTYNLGSPDLRWNDVYLSGNTIHLGDKQLTLANGSFNVEAMKITSTENSNSTTTGALTVSGGIGALGSVTVAGTVSSALVAATNISSGSISGSNGQFTNMTSSSIVATNQTSTNATVSNLASTNIANTNLSSGTVILSNGLTAGNAYIGNFSASTVNSNLVAATTITGANLSLSGNLYVAGTLTSVNITTTNLVDTNVSAGIARVSTNLAAIGDSNTVGSIFTTGGNVGINTTGPSTTLDVSGTARVTTSLTTGALYSTNQTSTNIVGTNISFGTLTVSGGFSASAASATIWEVKATNQVTTASLYASNVTGTNIVATNLSSGSLNLSTGLTSVNANVTTATISTLLNTNEVSTNISSATLNLSTGLTSASAQITNLNSTTSTIATLRNTDIITTNISGATLNLSTGLTSASIQVTNVNATTETIGTSRVTTSLIAIGNSNTLGNIITTGGNVAIGTTSPGARLHVAGSETSGDGTNAAIFIQNTASTNTWALRGGASGTNTPNNGFSISDNINYRMVISSTGNVGIGTITPTFGLDVAGTARVSTSLTAIGNSNTIGNIFTTGGNIGIGTTAPSVRFQVHSPDYSVMKLTTDSQYVVALELDSANKTGGKLWRVMSTHNAAGEGQGKFVIQQTTNSLNTFVIDSTGNIGIGTTTPSSRLHLETNLTVANTVVSTLASGISDNNFKLVTERGMTSNNNGDMLVKMGLNYNYTTDNAFVRFHRGFSSTGGFISFTTDTDLERMRIDGNGNVGIGTTSPSAALHVNGNVGISYGNGLTVPGQTYTDLLKVMWTGSVDQVRLYTPGAYSGTPKLTLQGDGNVGIGTTSPKAMLELFSTSQTQPRLILSGQEFYQSGQSSSHGIALLTGVNRDSNRQLWVGDSALLTSNTTNSVLRITPSGTTIDAMGTDGLTTKLLTLGNAGGINLNGNVGITTNSPSGKLHVSLGDATSAGNVPFWDSTYAVFGNIGNTGGAVGLGYHSVSGGSLSSVAPNVEWKDMNYRALIHRMYVGQSNTLALTLGSTGNLGIGTSAPSFTLDVTGTARFTNAITTGGLEVTGLTDTLNLTATNITSATLNLSTGLTSASIQVTNENVTTQTVATARITTSLVALGNSNTLGSIITTGGNVGIGTTPSTKLDVNGNATFRLQSHTPLTIDYYSALGTFPYGNNPTSGTIFMYGHDGGAFGGTYRPITIHGNVVNLSSGLSSYNTRFHITDSGNIGIGTTSPSVKFEVVGRGLMKNLGVGTSGALFLDDNNKGVMYSGNNGSVNTYFEGSYPTDGIAVFGYNDGVLGTKNGSNKSILTWNSRGNVGIGTTSPSTKLDINGGAASTPSLIVNSSGADSTLSLKNTGTGGKEYWIGSASSGAGAGSGNLYFYDATSSATRMVIGSTGNVGMGITSPGYAVHVSGDVYATGDVLSFSDARLKSNIITIDGALSKVKNLRGVYYKLNGYEDRKMGVIAQEVEQVIPEVVTNGWVYKGVSYGNIVGLLIEAMKDLSKSLDDSKQEISTLKQRLDQLPQ